MGRISKRKTATENTKVIQISKKIIKVGIYARLSSDADQKKNESIDVQIEIAKAYMEHFNENSIEQMELFDIYQDLGKTGTNFNRDEFTRLMQDIRLGDVTCVIVKDLSRFGRNYLEAGNYIEKIFPFLGVRFIAVADNFDTGASGTNTDSMATEIKNLVNDMYAKDFSVKAKIHLQQRREEGSYVGGPAPYGYVCRWENKIRKLVPDENTAPIIKLMYQIMIREKKYLAVCDELNKRRINPPVIYKSTKEVFCQKNVSYHGWDRSGIQRILKNPIYMGKLEQGKTSIHGKIEANRVRKDESEWVVKENSHEALVSVEDFKLVEKIMDDIYNENKAHKKKAHLVPIEENIFDNVLYCGACGRKMTRHSAVTPYVDGRIERVDAYSCLDGCNTKVERCKKPNRITKRALVDIIMPALRMEFAVYLEKPKKYVEYGNQIVEKAGARYIKQKRELTLQMERLEEEESKKYIEYKEGSISQSKYVELRMSNIKKLESIRNQITELQIGENNLEKVAEKFSKAIRALMGLKSEKELTKEMIDALIERINVYPGKRVEIIFRYSDDIMKGVK